MFHPEPPRKDVVPPHNPEIADDRGETKYFHGREKEVGGFLRKLSESKNRQAGALWDTDILQECLGIAMKRLKNLTVGASVRGVGLEVGLGFDENASTPIQILQSKTAPPQKRGGEESTTPKSGKGKPDLDTLESRDTSGKDQGTDIGMEM